MNKCIGIKIVALLKAAEASNMLMCFVLFLLRIMFLQKKEVLIAYS